jgi:hypothetical protein
MIGPEVCVPLAAGELDAVANRGRAFAGDVAEGVVTDGVRQAAAVVEGSLRISQKVQTDIKRLFAPTGDEIVGAIRPLLYRCQAVPVDVPCAGASEKGS